MARIAKKDREHHQFEIFREICDVPLLGTACVQERPDFLVRTDDAYVGIELTQYFKPAVPGRRPLQEQHALQATIVDRAHGIYRASGGTNLRVNVLFRGVDIHNRQAPLLAAALAGFVERCPLSDLQKRFDVRDEPGLSMVAAVYAYRCPDRVRALWRIATAGTVRPLSITDVQTIISGKDAGLRGYDQRATYNWLVIVLDGSAAAFARVTEEARTATYRTAFSEIHLLDIAAGTCTHFAVAPAAEKITD